MMAQLTKEITRLKTAVFYEDLITKMEYKDGDGEVRSYLERQHYLLLEDFCRPLRSALATKLRGNGQDSMLRSLGPALVRSRCFERSGHGYRLHFENTGSGALKKIRVPKLSFLIFLSNLLLFNRITKKLMRQKNGKFLLTKYIV